jgi:hypothetical protein
VCFWVYSVCYMSMCVVLRWCVVLCCIWSRCFVSYISLRYCISIHISDVLGFQGLLHINSFTCVVRVWIICDKSIFLILRCCFVMCCVWSRCFVSYLSLWWCICFYICGFVGSWKNLGILFFRCILWCVVRVLCSCVLLWPVVLVAVMFIVYVLWAMCLYDVVFAFIFVEFWIF